MRSCHRVCGASQGGRDLNHVGSVLRWPRDSEPVRAVATPHAARTWRGLPRGPAGPVGSLRPQGGLSEMPPEPRAIFRKISIAFGGILDLTPGCTRFIISVTSASSSLGNRHDASLMPGPESPRWGRPLPSSIRPRLAKFSVFWFDSDARADCGMLLPERHRRLWYKLKFLFGESYAVVI